MSIKETLEDLNEDVDQLVKKVHELKELPDEDATAIIDAMQQIEDKLSNLLAEHGVEIGDERVD